MYEREGCLKNYQKIIVQISFLFFHECVRGRVVRGGKLIF